MQALRELTSALRQPRNHPAHPAVSDVHPPQGRSLVFFDEAEASACRRSGASRHPALCNCVQRVSHTPSLRYRMLTTSLATPTILLSSVRYGGHGSPDVAEVSRIP